MKIDFHLHSSASKDSGSDPRQILNWAALKELDVLSITDHDSTELLEEFIELSKGYHIKIIPSVEATTLGGTHYLIYFTPALPLPLDDLELIDEVHHRGGLVGIAHPYRSDTGLMYNAECKRTYSRDEIDQILHSADLIEINNAKSPSCENLTAHGLWLKHSNLKPIGGSDSHHAATVGAIHTDVRMNSALESASLMAALRSNQSMIVTLPEMTQTNMLKAIGGSIEGLRKLMITFKPLIPGNVWRKSKAVYSKHVDLYAVVNARKSVLLKRHQVEQCGKKGSSIEKLD